MKALLEVFHKQGVVIMAIIATKTPFLHAYYSEIPQY